MSEYKAKHRKVSSRYPIACIQCAPVVVRPARKPGPGEQCEVCGVRG